MKLATLDALTKLRDATGKLEDARRALPRAEHAREEALEDAISHLALEHYDPDERDTGFDPGAIAMMVGVDREAVLGLVRKTRERAAKGRG